MGRTYACSDIHGVWAPFKKMMDYLQPDDTLYFLGDACDRGDSGIKIFQILSSDPRVKMIKGNHDEMMARCIPALYEDNMYSYSDLSLWYSNGGDKTAAELEHLSKENAYKIKKQIDRMPTELKYKSPAGHTVILEHAGYTPFDIPHRSHDPLWDRDHFHDNWVTGVGASEQVRDTYLVHGHTPVQYLKYMYGYNGDKPLTKEEMEQKKEWNKWSSPNDKLSWKPTVLCYCDGHKIDIDLCTIVSNRIALLDLDTFEEIYFDGDET